MHTDFVATREAVVLLSGGLDSTTVLALARAQGFCCNCLSFQYGQRQKVELDRARLICRQHKIKRHLVLRVDLNAIGGSALTTDLPVPKDRSPTEMEEAIPVTYVPARNILFLAHALSWAEVLGASDIFLGINAVDYSGYPDCRPEFLAAFTQMANLGTRAGVTGRPVQIHAPLMYLSKKEIILEGLRLGVDYSQTLSCYDPVADLACGRCDACTLRLQGFEEAGLNDPARYVENDPFR
ncbi:7-cyano-7-deazaguanine synthase QueC [Desulfobulbus alkaliphilus]|uniref:7-cyano-7-deazaguanine synthase QueC n=1 Tax=Desulfobulbus alkaliphilus TaxID=869814 RepID=UPI0019658E97|nr:7-cyano-7-deazaguanine synthase QueC [Desulfobulbus alkaliphilus]MBM9536593.1 7-cyano-7-deazaguanine synthase QueC [Desulfobulbus alkaliphilus]